MIDGTFEGLFYPPTIDGTMLYLGDDSDIFPGSTQATPVQIQQKVLTLGGGSQVFQPSFGKGHCDNANRWHFLLTYNSINGQIKDQFESIAAGGQYHDLTLWKPQKARYTGTGTPMTWYLPRHRRNAPQVYPDLTYRGRPTTTDNLPFQARLITGGVLDYSVLYVNTPADLDGLSAGQLAVSRIADVTGHVPFKLGTELVRGQILEISCFFLYEVSYDGLTVDYPSAGIERHAYTFEER